ncbi:MAG: hypothetical protein KAG97_09030, partial [Victivallales bacterium]|nr:hypothetical protein [Victivallales bacterium]
MKGTRGFSEFAMFVFIVGFSCLVRDGVADRAAKAENREFREFSDRKDLKPLPFTGESARIAAKAWLLSHPGDVPAVRFNDKSTCVDQTWTELSLSRILAYAYISKLALSGRSTKLATRADFANDTDFAEFTQLLFRFWMSLLSGFVFLFLMILTRRRAVSMFGGVAHALMPATLFGAAIELSPANFALPLIAITFVFGVWHLKNPSWRKALLAGIALIASVTLWSGAWTLFFFWGLAELLRIATGGASDQKRKELWFSLNAAALGATLIIAVTGNFSFFEVLFGSP